MNAPDPVQTAKDAYGSDLPEWVLKLARECERTSQGKVARRMGRSGAMVSQVLHNKYPGNVLAMKEIFLGVFDNGAVECPGLGNIPGQKCHEWRKKARHFAATNTERVRMFRACFTGEDA